MDKYSRIGGESLNKAKGDRGEIIAAGFLEKIGYKIIKTKFGKGRGEIDIIAESESGVLNFIEVKTRFESKFEKPYKSADKKKLNRIMDASNFFLMNSDIGGEKRLVNYGIISIEYIECNSIKLIFFENVFK